MQQTICVTDLDKCKEQASNFVLRTRRGEYIGVSIETSECVGVYIEYRTPKQTSKDGACEQEYGLLQEINFLILHLFYNIRLLSQKQCLGADPHETRLDAYAAGVIPVTAIAEQIAIQLKIAN